MTNDSILLSPSEVTRQDIVARLEETITTMAEELGVPVEAVKNVARGHFKWLSNKERKNRSRTIIRLRKKGYSNKEIALESGMSLPVVTLTVHKLVQEGLLDPQSRGRPSLSEKECQGDNRQIIHLWQKGYSSKAIAEALGLPLNTIRSWVRFLLNKGLIVPRRHSGTSAATH